MSWIERLRRKKSDTPDTSKTSTPQPDTHKAEPRQPGACPQCGFSYGWDGKDCNHCNPGTGSRKARKVTLKSPADRYSAASARVLAELQGGAVKGNADKYGESILRYRMQAAAEVNRLGLTGERAMAHYAERITTLLAKEHGLSMDQASRIFMDSLK